MLPHVRDSAPRHGQLDRSQDFSQAKAIPARPKHYMCMLRHNDVRPHIEAEVSTSGPDAIQKPATRSVTPKQRLLSKA
jgi:hypothetical protein